MIFFPGLPASVRGPVGIAGPRCGFGMFCCYRGGCAEETDDGVYMAFKVSIVIAEQLRVSGSQ
jgi:hypothetical protein